MGVTIAVGTVVGLLLVMEPLSRSGRSGCWRTHDRRTSYPAMVDLHDIALGALPAINHSP
jgi:hypothetical protein